MNEDLATPAPSHLLDPAAPGESWCILHSKPRCEKKILGLQAQRSSRMYLPTLTKVHNYGKRERSYDHPLFPGYVFACLRQEDESWYRSQHPVANLIPVLQEDRLLGTLRALEEALKAELSMEVLPFLQEGQEVMISGGPLKGTQARIAKVDHKERVILHLDLIQQCVALEMDASYLSPLRN